MLIVGLILVVVAALMLVGALVGGSNDPAVFDLGILDVETNTMGAFLLGAVTVLLFVVGLELIRQGVRRARKRRRDTKELNRLSEKLEAHEAKDRDANSDTGTDTVTDTRHDAP